MEQYTIQEAKEEIIAAGRQYLSKDKQGNYIYPQNKQNPIYICGVPGVGKTESVQQAANELKIGFCSCSMVHHTKQSALGLPRIGQIMVEGQEYEITYYTVSEIIAQVLKKVEKGQKEGILLLDEYNCISDTLMPASLGFLQNKIFGNTILPEGWLVVICGNPPHSVYNRSAKEFDMAVQDRLRVIYIKEDVNCFIEYATKCGCEQDILTYLSLNPSHGYRCIREKDKNEIVTFRGWMNLSDTLKSYRRMGITITRKMIEQFIKSDEIAGEFYRFLQAESKNEIFEWMQHIMEQTCSQKEIRMIKEANTLQQASLTNLCLKKVIEDMKEAIVIKDDLYLIRDLFVSAKEKAKTKEINLYDEFRNSALSSKLPNGEFYHKEIVELTDQMAMADAGKEWVLVRNFFNSEFAKHEMLRQAVTSEFEAGLKFLHEKLNNPVLLNVYLTAIQRYTECKRYLASETHPYYDQLIQEKVA